MSDSPRRTWHKALVFGFLSIIASLSTAIVWFDDSLERQRLSMASSARELQTAISHELTLRSLSVRAFETQASALLDGPISVALDLPSLMRPVAAKKGYELTLPAGMDSAELGSLTGLGDIPPTDSDVAREFAVAVGLTPIFRAALEHDPTSPWAYYISRHNFLYIYPRVSSDELFVSRELIDMHFQYQGKPLEQPERHIYWSKIYTDVGGKGLLATVSHPIFRKSNFIGTVSLDISAQTFLDLIKTHSPEHSSVRLLGDDGVDMLPNNSQVPLLDIRTLPLGEPLTIDDHELVFLQIPEASWYLVLDVPSSHFRTTALADSLLFALLLLFILSSLGLVLMLTRSLRKLAALSHFDSLTGLHNRRHLHDIGPIEFSRARRGLQEVGLLVIDLDHFKSYNDAMGHSAGDQALCVISQALKNTLRRDTDILCRVGGEEFVVISPVRDAEETESLAHRLCTAVRSANLPHPGSPASIVTASIGAITVRKDRAMTLEQAYELADKALYESKQSGRDRVSIA